MIKRSVLLLLLSLLLLPPLLPGDAAGLSAQALRLPAGHR
jgi:hypothetical protein